MLEPRSRIALSVAFLGLVAGAAHAGQVIDGMSGGRAYKLYVPDNLGTAPAPLILMLHGCTQDPAAFLTGSKMDAVADEHGFLVLYPDEPSSIQQLKCWQWFDAADQQRGSGEPAQLVAMIDAIGAAHPIDPARVYAAGISAGAAMAVILGATYPDRFAGIAVASGIEYAAATGGIASAGSVQSSGGPDPATQGQAAFSAMGGAHRTVPVIVFHGSADAIVAPVNGDQVVAQWTTTDMLAGASIPVAADVTEMGTVPGGRSYTTSTWHDQRSGAAVLRKIFVQGMGHAWSGGDSSASFTDPMGPSASEAIWAFFTGAADIPGNNNGGGGGMDPAGTMPHGGCSFAPVTTSPLTFALAFTFAFAFARRRRQR